jgi:hypothetical protein
MISNNDPQQAPTIKLPAVPKSQSIRHRRPCLRSLKPVPGTWRIAVTLNSLLLAVAAPYAQAGVNHATSTGFAYSATLSVAGIQVVNNQPQAVSTGTAPPVYSVSTAAAPITTVPTLGLFTISGTAQSSAASDVDGASGNRTTSAMGQVNDFALAIADLPLLPPLVEVGGNGTDLGSQCQVSGDGVTANITGTSNIHSLSVKISGQSILLPANPGPNTVISPSALGVAGLTLYLNEQTPVSGSQGETVTFTAMRLKLDSVNAGTFGILTGEFKIGVSTSTQYADSDNDGVSDLTDTDADGDGIPNSVEIANAAIAGGDTDHDGVADRLDLDSDNDGINDVIEAGGVDANGDGRQDGTDANQNGIVDTVEPAQGGTALPVPDSDSDGAKDYIDLDSDNDGLSDLVESGDGFADTTNDGVADGNDLDGDGIALAVDGSTAWGDAGPSTPIDSDGDGLPNYRDTRSQGPGSKDIDNAGLGQFDQNNDGMADSAGDADHDGVADVFDNDTSHFGGLGGPGGDTDGDGIPDSTEGSVLVDTDGDGVPDIADSDSDSDGIPDAIEVANAPANGDSDNDGVFDWRDLDSDNDGINDVIEAGGADANGNGRQDGTVDADQDGLIDTVDPSQGGTALPVPDSDGDGAKDYIDLDSDNDTVSDLLEGGSGAPDANYDGLVDGDDTDGDGIPNAVDGLATFGDADHRAPTNTDGTDVPDYLDPDSDNTGGPDIVVTTHGALDTNGDGRIDGPYNDSDRDGVDTRVDTIPGTFGGTGGCMTSGEQWRRSHFTAAELSNAAISGWTGDADRDGISNAEEYAFGTDPKAPNGQNPIQVAFTSGSSSGITLTVPRDTCTRSFVGLEYSTDLNNWFNAGPNATYSEETAGSLVVSVVGASPEAEKRLFVRLRISVP